MEAVQETSFEAYSVSSALEKVAFSVEQIVEKWLGELARGKQVTGLCRLDSSDDSQTAVAGELTQS